MKDFPIIKSRAPGRINLIGEHTDYNQGFVLPAAIDREVEFTFQENGSEHVISIVNTANQSIKQFSLDNLQPSLENDWGNYIMGVVSQFQKLGIELRGFDASFIGNVPIGSGVSSSAALECSFAKGLNHLFNCGLDDWQLIRSAMYAEHEFVGVKCGIMDQFASIKGRQNHAMVLDCNSLEFEYVPLELGDYAIVLIDSKVKHALATSEYNTRREECEQSVALLSKWTDTNLTSLRSVDEFTLHKHKERMDNQLYQRSKHVISENQRVLRAVEALKLGNIKKLGNYMYASHQSLSQDYAVSCVELDYLVDWTKDKTYVIGSRMMGGGFGGCTINLVATKNVDEFITQISGAYSNEFSIESSAYKVKIENGASIIL